MRRGLAAAAVLAVLLAAWWLQTRPVTVAVYFIRAEDGTGTLAAVDRTARARGPAALAAAALTALLEGPTEAERQAGLTSEIPPRTRLRSVRLEPGVVVVDLDGAVESGGGSASMLGRFWQIVYTATQFPGFPRVQILIDGQRRAALGGEGVIIDRPVARPATPPRF